MAHPPPSVTAVLPCLNLGAGVEFYERLGFTVENMGDDYAIVLSAHHEVFHLREVPDLSPATNPTMVFIHVDDPDVWHAELLSRGLAASPPVDEQWGVREFRFDDPSANTVRIGQGLR